MSNRKALITIVLVLGTITAGVSIALDFGVFNLEEQTTATGVLTDSEIEQYRETISEDLAVKKGIVILFSTVEDCTAFIENHGSDENILELGMGIVPLMETDDDGISYYSMSGNAVFETVFDSLQDGEFSSEPVEFGGMYCYVKRLGIESPDDEAIRQMVISSEPNE